jgi:amino acid transporter
VPFQVGVDRYLPAAFGKIHPRWKTPFVSILIGLLLYWRGAKARLS